ncbi:MAG: 5-(carboxyamino)imidazole ribonucleotide mutase [Candidatus Omnitrophota bacterium]|nr:5-(carboxyamino)imidazole ribonucleotide mutase [Candidatus Omnitrophota bacterium]
MKKIDVSVVMGSTSDLSIMSYTTELLRKFGVPFEVRVLSAHRSPDNTVKFAKGAVKRGIKVIIAGAGGAAHLAGVIASNTTLPVIGIPIRTRDLKGMDSLLSIVQMPGGIPVGTMAIGEAGAKNGAIFAVEILSVRNTRLRKKLLLFKKSLEANVKKKDKDLSKRNWIMNKKR